MLNYMATDADLIVITDMPAGTDTYLDLSLDAKIGGEYFGSTKGSVYGEIANTSWGNKR